MNWSELFYERIGKNGKPIRLPIKVTEGYILFELIVVILFLFWGDKIGYIGSFRHVISCWILIDIFCNILRETVISHMLPYNRKKYVYYENDERKYSHDYYLTIRGRARWLVLSFTGAILIVFCYANIIYKYKDSFYFMNEQCNNYEHIDDPTTALYYSALTFTTLGYGDIKPVNDNNNGKIIVTTELGFFILFVLLRLPLAVSVLKVKYFHEIDCIINSKKWFDKFTKEK